MRIRLLLCSLLAVLSVYGQEVAGVDSIVSVQSDSLVRAIRHDMALNTADEFVPDTLFQTSADSTLTAESDTAGFKPVSQKSLWYAALFPGLGQIYNRRYWKLPIVVGGAVGITYAITWNNKYYEAYTYAYRDLNDNDPRTNYHIKLLGEDAASKSSLITNRQQSFRRQRDLSIIIGVLFYGLCILDAYVDAELFNFDISDDISLGVGRPASDPSTAFPTYDQQITQATPISLSWHINF